MSRNGYSGPEKFRPLGTWEFFGYSLLFAIPVAGLVLLIIFSLNDSNICRRNFARSYFCGLIVFLILIGVVGVGFGALGMLSELLNK